MNLLTSAIEYFQGALAELRQVRWPTRKQAVRLSIIVIAFTFATAAVYGVIDFLLGRIVAFLLSFA